jgi:hypothetical protein
MASTIEVFTLERVFNLFLQKILSLEQITGPTFPIAWSYLESRIAIRRIAAA